ncbi:hypothetical protein [Tenacibaculum sp. M341]|uniref:hypothetical protein n=1 Tax=Tenacibaculum sp. M341 TaxID=2530339 RepID=UPI001043CCDB|nr:hypothetical protein [Tenacibaculum sp. M341]TCI84852.1 hypothetical protein EYW44_19135 [Tenacibaculum sp. M341]
MEKSIESIEKQLPPKRKNLLHLLRHNDWEVIEISYDCHSDNYYWAFDQKWIIESRRENYGFTLDLTFYKYNGLYDGVDEVIVTLQNINNTSIDELASITFDAKKYEIQLNYFLDQINKLRRKKL